MPTIENRDSERPRCRECTGRMGRYEVSDDGNAVYSNFEGHPYCESCYQRYYRSCDDCGAEVRTNDLFQGNNGSSYCECCYSEQTRDCHACEATDLGPRDVRCGPGGVDICGNCYNTGVNTCTDCSGQSFVAAGEERDPHFCCPHCANRPDWNDRGFYTENPVYDEIKSKRKFGIEIETSACNDHISIRNDTVFGCKEDGSVDGKEFVSPVLFGDEGLAEVRKICGHARRLGWEINSACGLHIHLDLSEESNENCFKVAAAYMHTYDFWTSFISDSRKRNYYCARHSFGPADLVGCNDRTDFRDWCSGMFGGERYNWVNLQAYTRFKTVELRHHAASLNPTKLVNWIKAHTRFIDGVTAMTIGQVNSKLGGRSVYDQMNVISEYWDDDSLTNHYKERAELFGKPFVTRTLVGVE